ncbi:hypothetical protein FLAG1_11566 [Fusarium langsethiae]|uniref:Uncharacterized protein n=1 Tax=Fusarium langsethiae TaxID=179993 RepID=A0A0M9EMJ0_FUSLA|nr:hypothetical protein FLAG1_11566 [Fusarium langsethiae]
MSAETVYGGPIPGLQMPLTIHDLRHGRKYHNELSYGNEDQDQSYGSHRESLRQLLETFDVQDIFGLVDKHKHFDVPLDSHLIGTIGTFGACPKSLFYLTRTVADKTFNPNELCGHKFTYIPGQGLRPYEFHQGPLLDRSKVGPEFFSQFTNYLNKYNITSIGLEYVIPQLSQIETHEVVSEVKRWMILIEASKRSREDGAIDPTPGPLQKRARTDTEIQAEVPTAVNAAESLQEHQTSHVEPPTGSLSDFKDGNGGTFVPRKQVVRFMSCDKGLYELRANPRRVRGYTINEGRTYEINRGQLGKFEIQDFT